MHELCHQPAPPIDLKPEILNGSAAQAIIGKDVHHGGDWPTPPLVRVYMVEVECLGPNPLDVVIDGITQATSEPSHSHRAELTL